MYQELIEETQDKDAHTGMMIALWPPPDVAANLALPGGEEVGDLHLTVVYCAEAPTDEVQVARVVSRLADLADQTPPIRAKLAGPGLFGECGDDDMEVRYASVDAPALEQFRAQCLSVVWGCGLEVSREHGYTPHITLQYAPKGSTETLPTVPPLEFRFETVMLAVGEERVAIDLRGRDYGMKVPYGPVVEALCSAAAELRERDFSAGQRRAAAKSGEALPDGSFPIKSAEDLANAARAIGRAKDPAAARAHIRKRARALGRPDPLVESAVGVLAELRESSPGPLGFVHDTVMEASSTNGEGSKWRVILIKAGTSGNRVHYPDEVLKKSAPMFEGVRAYADHPTRDDARNRPERSVRDVVGWYDNVRWDGGLRALTADFNVLSSAGWLREGLRDAWGRGKTDLFGFSIHAEGTKSGRVVEGGHYLESIDRVRSTDVVTTPGAGGRVLEMLEAQVDDATDALVKRFGQELREAWHTKGKHLSSAHKAAISAALKGKHRSAGSGPMNQSPARLGKGASRIRADGVRGKHAAKTKNQYSTASIGPRMKTSQAGAGEARGEGLTGKAKGVAAARTHNNPFAGPQHNSPNRGYRDVNKKTGKTTNKLTRNDEREMTDTGMGLKNPNRALSRARGEQRASGVRGLVRAGGKDPRKK